MRNKTMAEAAQELGEARDKFFLEFCKSIGVVWMVEKLNNLLKRWIIR